jgi:uncharacterized membrane protein
MRNIGNREGSIFHLLARHAFGPLLLSSMLACSLLAMRMRLSGSPAFVFLVWNLFLAWLPYGWSLAAARLAARRPSAWWWLLVPGALWLLFFPNALYLVTDFVHLRPREGIPLWYDIGMLAAFALSGCFLAVASLHTMQNLVAAYLGNLASWLFVFGVVGLNGLGVYLGRFLRWNSWDVFLDPRGVLADTLHIVANPLANRQATGVIGMFAALLLVCYVMYWGMGRQDRTIDA